MIDLNILQLKKRFLITALACSVAPIQIFSQTYSFAYHGADRPLPCNVFKEQPYNFTNAWKVSHGVPNCGDLYGQSTYTEGRLVGKWDAGDDEKSDGLFIAYNFVQGHSYTIIVSVAQDDGDPVGLDVFAANGVTESTSTTCDEEVIPNVDEKQEIYSVPSVYDGPTGNFESETISNWKPDKDYNQIWLMSRQWYYDRSGSLFIDQIVIIDNTGIIIQPSPPSSCPSVTRLYSKNVTSTGFTIGWTMVGSYNVFNISTSSGRQLTTTDFKSSLSGFSSCHIETVNVTHICQDGSASPPVSIQVKTLSKNPSSYSLSTDLSLNQSITYKASDHISLLSGFHYKATAQQNGMDLKIQNCSTNPSGRISSNPESNQNATAQISHSVYHKNKDLKASLYPNPVESEFTISVPDDRLCDITLRGITGEVLRTWHNQNSESTFNIAGLPQGLYIIEIKTGTEQLTYKIVKK